jgi:putative ubiquitin-RnfH superfamily antitoxin RatB of RatAB toxin-antitoxin module
MAGVEQIGVEVVYVGATAQFVCALRVPVGTTLRGAIDRSRVLDQHPEICLTAWRVGVYGTLRALDAPVAAGDRVEIYRPLRHDAKEARRRRAVAGRHSAAGSERSR